MTLVSSANNIVFDTEFMLRGSYLYILWIIEALELIYGELHVSLYPSQKFWVELGDFTLTFCLLLVK